MKSVVTHRPTVLLLEGAHLRRRQTAGVLSRGDCDVIEVHTCEEALVTLEAREDVDVLLADIDAAGGMNGVELSRCVHERWPGLGLVLTSERVRHLRPDEVPGNGCFLPHPVPGEMLLNEIREAAYHP